MLIIYHHEPLTHSLTHSHGEEGPDGDPEEEGVALPSHGGLVGHGGEDGRPAEAPRRAEAQGHCAAPQQAPRHHTAQLAHVLRAHGLVGVFVLFCILISFFVRAIAVSSYGRRFSN